jgi:hypothetical protein
LDQKPKKEKKMNDEDTPQPNLKPRLTESPLSPPKGESFLQQKRTTQEIIWMIVIIGLLLLLIFNFLIPRARSAFNGTPLTWTWNTPKLLPIGQTLAFQSVTSGKFLQVIPLDQAIPNCDQVPSNSSPPLLLEGSGSDKGDTTCQWIVEAPSESQRLQYGGVTIRLRNVKTNIYLTERVNPVSDFPSFTWQAQETSTSGGSPIGSALYATPSEKKNPNEILIIGADLANSQYGRYADVINEDSPFFLSSDRQGRILAPSKVSLGRESVWLIHSL